MKYNQQKASDKVWTDESGTEIPYNRTTKVERLHERSSAKIAKAALDVNKRLVAFNDLISQLSQEAYDAYMQSKGISKKTKGNYTWYNFDRSIKIEINVNEPIVFDSLTITAAKEKLDEFLDANIESKNAFIKEMIIDAFETQRSGSLDTKQVLKLTSYEDKVKSPKFSEAIKLIREAIRRPKSKTYRRVWILGQDGKYQNVELNLSSL
tara:strand:+ start:13052 stop:13678 length:627 start_codon:yes stop_codon:yes gene_type:complete